MALEWTSSGLDLAVDLDVPLGRRAALEAALREAIRDGRLAPGIALPSSRTLAADLGIARGTVTAAYEQLVAEGWLVTRPGAGTAVAGRAQVPPEVVASTSARRWWRHDFHSGTPDVSAFPRRAWAAAVRRALHEAPDAAFGYDAELADLRLPAELAAHLGRARGVVATTDRVVPCAGMAHALTMLAAVLRRRRELPVVAVEDPCLWLHRETLLAAGVELRLIPADDGGLCVDELLGAREVGAVVVTPAHHFPLGVPLAPDRRAALVEWASANDVLVLEDDYDGELRYDRKPLGALQALAPDHVVYYGTASKSFAPGLRLGWLVAPEAAAGELRWAKTVVGRGPSALDQLALAELLGSGSFARHIRRQRAVYRARRDHLVDVLSAAVPGVRFHGLAAGLRLLVELPEGWPGEDAVVAAAAARRIRLVPIRQSWVEVDAPPRTFAVGYGAPPDHGYADAVNELAAALADARP